MSINSTAKKKRLSIIVPIYNVEPYLEKCLTSLLTQDIPLSDYEVVCINDGSPDNSRIIIQKVQEEFPNVILIDKQNEGVSRARNDGIDVATGKYVLFIDPDDFIHHNCLRNILDNADRPDSQVSFLNFTVINEFGNTSTTYFKSEDSSRVISGIEAYFLARGDGLIDPDRIWGILFNTSFLNKNNLRFLPEVPFLEDGEFIARILALAEKCVFDSTPFYLRTTRLGSATNSSLLYSIEATRGFILSAVSLKNFQLNSNLNLHQVRFLNQPIVKFVVLALSSCKRLRYFKRYQWIKRELYSNGLSRCDLNSCNKTYTRYGIAYNISPLLVPLTSLLFELTLRIRKGLSVN
jgi:glycosyltransferase involved in cell wall biosynthesis